MQNVSIHSQIRDARTGLIRRTLLAAVACAGLANQADAAFTLTLQQVGANVVASGSGSLNLGALTLGTTTNSNAGIGTGSGLAYLGATGSASFYSGIAGPTSFGSGTGFTASSATGERVGIAGSNQLLRVPAGYVSGVALSGTATFNNQTFASLGFTPGTYVYTWGSGANADQFTVTSVPEPSTWAALAISAGLLGVAWRHHARRAVRG